MTKKFRFGVQTSGAKSGEAWREKARKIEDLGYSTLLIPDHFDDQYAPMPAMAVAAEATSTLRVSGLVLDNDYKHPLVLAKEIATLDVLSGGRVDLGLGAGWMETDYVASGIPYDAPGVRISRFHEGLRIFKGTYYTITNHNGTPRPVQKPVPVLIGGGGKRVLRIAAREADIISVNFNLAPGKVNQSVMKTGDATSTEEKIGWIRDAAGARIDELELSVTVFVAIVSDDQAGMVGRISAGFGMTPEETLASPHALVGSVDQIADALMERRERFGFSYVVFSGDGYAALAPVVKKLAGN
jgi:probable F420-dependent oxidoreductase